MHLCEVLQVRFYGDIQTPQNPRSCTILRNSWLQLIEATVKICCALRGDVTNIMKRPRQQGCRKPYKSNIPSDCYVSVSQHKGRAFTLHPSACSELLFGYCFSHQLLLPTSYASKSAKPQQQHGPTLQARRVLGRVLLGPTSVSMRSTREIIVAMGVVVRPVTEGLSKVA